MPIEPDIGAKEAAALIGWGYAATCRLLASGAVPTATRTPGGYYRVQPSGLEEWLRTRSVEPAQPAA